MADNMLTSARGEIDRINRELTALLVERMKQADLVAQWKAANGQPVSVPAREEAIIRAVREWAGAGFADDIEPVFRAIFSATCAREARLIGKESDQ